MQRPRFFSRSRLISNKNEEKEKVVSSNVDVKMQDSTMFANNREWSEDIWHLMNQCYNSFPVIEFFLLYLL